MPNQPSFKMITEQNKHKLEINNYVRLARGKNYWFDFSLNKMKNYENQFGDKFHLIIYGSSNDRDYYLIPYSDVKKVFNVAYLTKNPDRPKRWIGRIQEGHMLAINNSGQQVAIGDCYARPLPSSINATYLKISEKDIEGQTAENEFLEGGKVTRLTNHYERNPKLRAKAIEIHGTVCKVCKFDFSESYGPHGMHYIEVHHLKLVSKKDKPELVDPQNDMTVLCSNCHRMVHRRKDQILSIEQLIEIFKPKKI